MFPYCITRSPSLRAPGGHKLREAIQSPHPAGWIASASPGIAPGAPWADFIETGTGHGRIETRRIGCGTRLNAYLVHKGYRPCHNFPRVAQAFLIEREVVQKKTGKTSCEIALGLSSRPPNEASPERLLATNRGHWRIEAMHCLLAWNFDEDRCRIRTGHGPENAARLRRFAIGVLKSFQKPGQSIASMMRKLWPRSRIVLDYLRLTHNAAPARQDV
jgi:hypothetical protein